MKTTALSQLQLPRCSERYFHDQEKKSSVGLRHANFHMGQLKNPPCKKSNFQSQQPHRPIHPSCPLHLLNLFRMSGGCPDFECWGGFLAPRPPRTMQAPLGLAGTSLRAASAPRPAVPGVAQGACNYLHYYYYMRPLKKIIAPPLLIQLETLNAIFVPAIIFFQR